MKNLMVGFVAGVLATIIVITLHKEEKATLSSPSTEEITSNLPAAQVVDDEQPTAALTSSGFSERAQQNAVALSENKQTEQHNDSPGRDSRDFSERANKVLLEMDLRDAKRKLRNILPRNSPKLDALLAATQAKLEQELALMSEASQEFSVEDTFDEDGNPRQISLSPEDAQELRLRREQREARAERTRQEFEDAMRNMLNDEEFDAYRQQELASANESHQRMILYSVDNLEESIPDLSDYQFSEIQRLASSIPNLNLAHVPFGSQTGTNASHMMSFNDNSPLSQFYQEVESLLSATQLEEWQNKPRIYQTAETVIEE